MADELGNFQEHQYFTSFDYVLRHYFFPNDSHHHQNHHLYYHVRALGNSTCGSSPPLPTLRSTEPRWGVHWGFLDAHKPHALLLRSPSSIVPVSQRKHNCGFIGRHTKQRELMKQELEQTAPKANCQIQFSKGFAVGNSKLQYLADNLQDIKIGINPPGNNVECHRLPELLALGTIPAMLDANYLHATFRSVPGIIGQNWTDVAWQIETALSQENKRIIDDLSWSGAKFYEELKFCMRSDMDIILSGSFGDYYK